MPRAVEEDGSCIGQIIGTHTTYSLHVYKPRSEIVSHPTPAFSLSRSSSSTLRLVGRPLSSVLVSLSWYVAGILGTFPLLNVSQRAIHVECDGSDKYWNHID